jgi:hypothetical protein
MGWFRRSKTSSEELAAQVAVIEQDITAKRQEIEEQRRALRDGGGKLNLRPAHVVANLKDELAVLLEELEEARQAHAEAIERDRASALAARWRRAKSVEATALESAAHDLELAIDLAADRIVEAQSAAKAFAAALPANGREGLNLVAAIADAVSLRLAVKTRGAIGNGSGLAMLDLDKATKASHITALVSARVAWLLRPSEPEPQRPQESDGAALGE